MAKYKMEQAEGQQEEAELEKLSFEEILNNKLDELGTEWGEKAVELLKLVNQMNRLVQEKYPELSDANFETEEGFPEGIKARQKEALIDAYKKKMMDSGSIGKVKKTIMDIETSRLPYIDGPIKKIKELMQEPLVDRIIATQDRMREIDEIEKKIKNRIKIKEVQESLKAA